MSPSPPDTLKDLARGLLKYLVGIAMTLPVIVTLHKIEFSLTFFDNLIKIHTRMTKRKTTECDYCDSNLIEMATSNCDYHKKRVVKHMNNCQTCKEKYMEECRLAGNTEGLKIFEKQ